jgi:hypothetical protein
VGLLPLLSAVCGRILKMGSQFNVVVSVSIVADVGNNVGIFCKEIYDISIKLQVLQNLMQ